jgi:hypothetical protein
MRDGFTLEGPHSSDCWAVGKPRTFIITDDERPRRHDLRRNGNRNGSTLFHRFRCQDPHCTAVLLVRWDTMADVLDEGIR